MDQKIIPKEIYHATFEKNVISIMLTGLEPGCDGLSYFCDKPYDAVKFLVLKQLTTNQNEKIAVIKIYTEFLDGALIEEGFDHSPKFFGNPFVLTYPTTIHAEAMDKMFQIYG